MTPTANGSMNELCLAGVEDGSFKAFQREASHSVLCCVEMASDRIEAVKLSRIAVDGLDATEKLLNMLEGVAVDAVILGGITFAGFNIIDPRIIHQETNAPVIVYSGEKPDNDAMFLALKKHFEDWIARWRIVERLGVVHEAVSRPGEPPVYFEVVGGSARWAEEVLRSSALICRIPEPVRVAGLIARGVSRPAC